MNLFLFLFIYSKLGSSLSICKNPVIAIKYGRHCRAHVPHDSSEKFGIQAELLKILFGKLKIIILIILYLL